MSEGELKAIAQSKDILDTKQYYDIGSNEIKSIRRQMQAEGKLSLRKDLHKPKLYSTDKLKKVLANETLFKDLDSIEMSKNAKLNYAKQILDNTSRQLNKETLKDINFKEQFVMLSFLLSYQYEKFIAKINQEDQTAAL
jgi:hypothetical protein